MQSILRQVSRAPRTGLLARATGGSVHSRRAAHSSYGNEQSGHEQGQDEVNPKSHHEHPGPESPAANKGSTADDKGSTTSSSTQSQTGSDSNQKSKPAIHHPKSEAEKDDPEVRKHNEELRNRHEQSENQLSEKDNKVPPGYWKGDVGSSGKE